MKSWVAGPSPAMTHWGSFMQGGSALCRWRTTKKIDMGFSKSPSSQKFFIQGGSAEGRWRTTKKLGGWCVKSWVAGPSPAMTRGEDRFHPGRVGFLPVANY